MITPLDIENKKFSKRALNGYSTEEVDDFLDELTIDYEKLYKEAADAKRTIESQNTELTKYREMESTLQSTLLMAQTAAEEVKMEAQKQADSILANAESSATEKLGQMDNEIETRRQEIDAAIESKQRELDDLQKQFDDYKANMESMLISQLELLKNPKPMIG